MLAFYLTLVDSEEDRKKVEQLYYQYRNLMFYVARDVLRDDRLAEDAVHQAFVRIIKHLDGVEEIVSHKTRCFVVIVVRNISKTMYVKRKHELGFADIEESQGHEFVDQQNVETQVVTQMTIDDIKNKIADLPQIYRDVMELKYYYDRDEMEIAQLLGISYAAARKRLQRARELVGRRRRKKKGV